MNFVDVVNPVYDFHTMAAEELQGKDEGEIGQVTIVKGEYHRTETAREHFISTHSADPDQVIRMETRWKMGYREPDGTNHKRRLLIKSSLYSRVAPFLNDWEVTVTGAENFDLLGFPTEPFGGVKSKVTIDEEGNETVLHTEELEISEAAKAFRAASGAIIRAAHNTNF